jgi:dihydropyrimidine dehydrogenase (NAD+) subunit PreT
VLRHFRKGMGQPPDGVVAPRIDTGHVTLPDVYTELLPTLAEGEALLEADACLECGGPYAPAPCTEACPAGVDVPGFVGAIARGDPEGAAELIFAENLLGGSCARVCPVETLCEGACVLAHEAREPIAIGRLQRYATEVAFAQGVRLPRKRRRTGKRVAVLGAGPAGLACAGELALLGHDVTVYDGRDEPGGLVRFAIAPYRQLREPLTDESTAIARLGVTFRFGFSIDSHEALRALEDEHDACVLAVGLGADLDVGYPGDDHEGVWNSLPFIEKIKTGDAPDVGDRVAVIGGGNTAIDVAREARRLGASEVTLVYRRTEAEMPAYPQEVEEAREEGVSFLWLTVPVRFLGVKRLTGIECRKMRLGAADTSGRPRPEEVPGSEFVLLADTVVKAVGQQPRHELLSWIEGLELRKGLITVDELGGTGNARWFAAGDAVNGGVTVVEAVREAKLAAHGVDAFFGGRR